MVQGEKSPEKSSLNQFFPTFSGDPFIPLLSKWFFGIGPRYPVMDYQACRLGPKKSKPPNPGGNNTNLAIETPSVAALFPKMFFGGQICNLEKYLKKVPSSSSDPWSLGIIKLDQLMSLEACYVCVWTTWDLVLHVYLFDMIYIYIYILYIYICDIYIYYIRYALLGIMSIILKFKMMGKLSWLPFLLQNNYRTLRPSGKLT